MKGEVSNKKEWRVCNEQLGIQLIRLTETPATDCEAMWDIPVGARLCTDGAGGCHSLQC